MRSITSLVSQDSSIHTLSWRPLVFDGSPLVKCKACLRFSSTITTLGAWDISCSLVPLLTGVKIQFMNFFETRAGMHLKARAWGSLKSQLTVQLFANGQRMFPLGQSPCNLFAHLDRWSCSPSFLLVSPWCVRCRPPPWYFTIRFQRRHRWRRWRRRMLPCSADGARDDGDGVGDDDGRESQREGRGREARGRKEGGSHRLGKVQRLHSPLRTAAAECNALARSRGATRGGGGGNQAD